MKLSTILILSFILMGLIGSLAGTYYYYTQSNALLEEKVIDNLESTAVSIKHFIEEVLEVQKDRVEIIATQDDLTIEKLQEIRDLEHYFYEIFVLDSNGIIIASSDESQIGIDKSNDAYFIRGRKNSYLKPVYFSESVQQESITVSTPFNEGVLVARTKLQSFNEIISDRTGLGETGEILLAYKGENGETVFFTERRFTETAGEGTGILPMDKALAGEEKIVFDTVDYRNIEVIAVTRYIEEINVGMVVKIDEVEALGIARNQLVKTSVIIIIMIFIFFSIAGFFIARMVSKPIKKLTFDVDEVTSGKLDIQLEKSSITEVQSLTDSLNRILASLKLAILRTGVSKRGLGIGDIIESKNKAEEEYQALYESSEDAMMKLSPPEWNFTACNPATVKMFGVKDEQQFTSLGPQDLSPEKQPDGQLSSVKAKAMIMQAMKDGSNSFDWTHKRYKGKDFAAHVLLTKVKSSNGEYLQATVKDLTNVKNLEINSKTKKRLLELKKEADKLKMKKDN